MIHLENRVHLEPLRSRRFVVGFASSVVAGALLALVPAVALAVDTPVVPQSGAPVVFVVIILLLGSVTAGIFFATPLRTWLGRDQSDRPSPGTASGLSAPIADGLPRMPGGDIYGNEYDADPSTGEPAAAMQQAMATPYIQPAPQPVAPPTLYPPTASGSAAPVPQARLNAPKPAVNPWSTGITRPDPNMDRRGAR